MKWFLALALLGLSAEGGWSQTQVHFCYALPGSPFCKNVTAAKPLPVQEGTPGTAPTGTAHQVRICYAIPNSPFCQNVDAAHPLPVQ